uniref:Uncharacterized protein n=1 Tax=Setaria italica TaxID=4555 RepID=K3XU46_SETIT
MLLKKAIGTEMSNITEQASSTPRMRHLQSLNTKEKKTRKIETKRSKRGSGKAISQDRGAELLIIKLRII